MITRKGTLFDQGMSCVMLLVLGISNASFGGWSGNIEEELL